MIDKELKDKIEKADDVLGVVNVIDQDIQDIVKGKYLDYAMSVILDRALPDARDGLKPVHRRILYAMNLLGTRPNTPYKKSARIVGDVIGKYHPHGDTSVYDAMVRLSQHFSMRLPLVDGQGNFGSIDGDSPAAMRYTEVRLSQASYDVFKDMPFKTVDFQENYDGSEIEPSVLPFRYPNLVINGVQGIAVGMATDIPQHNPIEAINCVIKIVQNRVAGVETTTDDLLSIMPAPDFPTGGLIHGSNTMRAAFEDGRASMKLRARYSIEDIDGRDAIVIDEIPYGVDKTKLLLKIIEMAEINNDSKSIMFGKSKVEGIYDTNDESSKDGIRLIVVIENGFDPDVVFNQLAKYTYLETSVQYNATVVHNRQPVVVGLTKLFNIFIDFRLEVIVKRINFLLEQNKDKLHIFEALIKAIQEENLDSVINLIRTAKNTAEAKAGLCELLEIDDRQASSILDLRLQRLTGMELDVIIEEHIKFLATVAELEEVLADNNNIYEIIIEELLEEIETFKSYKNKGFEFLGNANPLSNRLSIFQENIIENNLSELTKREESTIVLSKMGYIRRVAMSDIEEQNRGTLGRRRIILRRGDFVESSINCYSHSDLMFITNIGKVHTIKAYEISTNEKSVHINNILDGLMEGEEIVKMISVDLSAEDRCLAIVTQNGIVKLSKLEDYEKSVRKGGLYGITLDENDTVIFASECSQENEIILANDQNLIIRFKLSEVKIVNRRGKGVLGMRLNEGSKIIGGSVIDSKGYLICVTENGMVKITDVEGYNLQKRGGKGTVGFKMSARSGDLLSAIFTKDLDIDIITNTKNGISNRISIDDRKVTSRNTSGVNLVKIDNKDILTSVFIADKNIESDEDLESPRVNIGEDEVLTDDEMDKLIEMDEL